MSSDAATADVTATGPALEMSPPRRFLEPDALPDRLPDRLLRQTRLLMGSRRAWERRPPMPDREDGLPVLIISGAHDPVFTAVARALCAQLGAEHIEVPGEDQWSRADPPVDAASAG